MRPMEIIVSATKHAAAVMGRKDDLGTLEKGKWADLVLLDADPQADIKNPRRIFRVMKGGGWGSDSSECRIAFRGGRYDPGHHGFNLGFRVVMEEASPATKPDLIGVGVNRGK